MYLAVILVPDNQKNKQESSPKSWNFRLFGELCCLFFWLSGAKMAARYILGKNEVDENKAAPLVHVIQWSQTTSYLSVQSITASKSKHFCNRGNKKGKLACCYMIRLPKRQLQIRRHLAGYSRNQEHLSKIDASVVANTDNRRKQRWVMPELL